MTNTYWNNNGTYQAQYDKLCNELIPSFGECTTEEGEYLRAITKIYYDAYNNGFGNNTSGPYNFLVQKFGILSKLPEFVELAEAVNSNHYISEYEFDKIEPILNKAVDIVIEYILNRNGEYTRNTYDMYDFADSDRGFDVGDEYEYEDEYEEYDE
jgi:hypothetical protein